MKTLSKLSIYVLALAAIAAVSCKGKTGSATSSDSGKGSVASSGNATAAAAKRGDVIDSLNITDPEEKKFCALYDEAITEYIKQIQLVAADTTRLKTFQDSAFDKKFAAESKKLEPEMKTWSNTLRTNPSELMKFEKFSIYESQRLVPAVTKYQQIIMKNYMPK